MASFIRASNIFVFSSSSTRICSESPYGAFTTQSRRQHSPSFDPVVAKKSQCLGFSVLKKSSGISAVLLQCSCSGLIPWCKGWESEGDLVLEAEILEFMPNVTGFLSKKELIDARRIDLADEVYDDLFNGDNRVFQQRFDGFSIGDSSYLASSSGGSIEIDDGGIDGISSRSEKGVYLDFGVGLIDKVGNSCVWRKDDRNDWRLGITAYGVSGIEKRSRTTSVSSSKESLNDSGGMHIRDRYFFGFDDMRNSVKPEMWRTRNIQRASFSDTEFEAADSSESRVERVVNDIDDEMLTMEKGANETSNMSKELKSDDKQTDRNQILSCLQHIKSKPASVLDSLTSRTDAVASDKGYEISSEELQEFSDTWEFQDTETINTKDELRSVRAKLDKMTLAVIEAQKIVEEKQKRIHYAQKSLHLLQNAYIVWHKPSSEVLLTGSFDGWVSQRKMQRSSVGFFYLWLKLYPGRYEIKFIVDGKWMIDPLHPIVGEKGYENNVLIISQVQSP